MGNLLTVNQLTGTLTINSSPLTAWVLSSGQQVTVYAGNDGNYYVSPSGGTSYPATALTFTNPASVSATGTLSLSGSSISLGILSQDASIVASETVNGVTDHNVTLTISNSSIISAAGVNASTGAITITAGNTTGGATINVHPTSLGNNTSQDRTITVNVSSFVSNGGGGGISYGTGTGVSNGGVSILGSVISQPFTGLQMPTGSTGTFQGLQMPASNDLSARYANVNGTIYDKATGQGFSTPAQFFAAAGVNSFTGLIFDTTWQPAQVQGASTSTTSASTTYTVQKGDTLWNIAKKYYGDGKQWRTILSANSSKVKNPKSLRVGTVLVIPGANN